MNISTYPIPDKRHARAIIILSAAFMASWSLTNFATTCLKMQGLGYIPLMVYSIAGLGCLFVALDAWRDTMQESLATLVLHPQHQWLSLKVLALLFWPRWWRDTIKGARWPAWFVESLLVASFAAWLGLLFNLFMRVL